ncbi:hypothetical protein D9M71_651590 [compost metagenome]
MREQRRDPVQRAGDHCRRRGLVQIVGSRRQRRHGHQAHGLLRQGQEPGPVGIAVRRHRSRAVRRLRRWHARRLQAQVLAAWRRRYRLPVAGTPGRTNVRRRHRQSGYPYGYRPGHGGGRQRQHGVPAAQHGAVLRPRILRLLHPLPRWLAMERQAPDGHRER